jgi:TPR repeat protein
LALPLFHWQSKSFAQQPNKATPIPNSNAQINLAVLYENGRGTAVDFAQANLWYRKASVQGDGIQAIRLLEDEGAELHGANPYVRQ